MKSHIILILQCLLVAVASSQEAPNHFVVGSWGISPDYIAPTDEGADTIHTVWPVFGTWNDLTAPPPPPDSIRFLLPRQRLLQASDLGLNTIYVRFDHHRIVRTDNPLGINAVAEVCAMADAENLDVCVEDMELGERLLGERIMLHPESGYDFYSRGDFRLAQDPLLDDHPIIDTDASRNPLQTGADNAVVIEAGRGEISTPSFARIEELSVVTGVTQGTSGRYHLSVIVKDHSETWTNPPNDTTAVLYVHVETLTSWGTPRTITFALSGSAFYWDSLSTTAIRDSAFEYILGGLELIDSNVGLRFVSTMGNSGWSDTTAFCGRKIRDLIGDSVAIMAAMQNFNIRITAGNTGAKFLLDAVCLTNPGTMGLFNPDLQGVLAVHRAHRGTLRHRMEAIVQDTGSTTLPGLRMIGFPEQIPRYACWLTSRLGRLLLDDVSGGSVLAYITSSSATDLTTMGTMHADFVSGAYYYPLYNTHPRPTLAATDPAEYYESLTQPHTAGFVEMGMVLRDFVTQRNKFSPALPWIPWIQNHSQLNQTNPPAYWDGLSHREPSAAEMRQQCNTALALGARGMMFYSFASIPWHTGAPFWPADTAEWVADTTGGNPRPLDPNAGLMGFLGEGNVPRVGDWNGENKWDSTRRYITEFLRPVGDFIVSNDLRFRNHKFWHLSGDDAGTNELVSMVFSERQDLPHPRDIDEHTWVQISEFEDQDQVKYLFVINGRTHPEGQRHITVKLNPTANPNAQCVVENLFTGDIWVVRPSPSPDDSSKANGFTDYFRPGDANLYRLRSSTTPQVLLPPEITGDLYVTPDADLSLVGGNEYAFHAKSGLFVDGYFNAQGTTFSATTETWLGIYARNDGSVYLENCTVDGGSIVAGSLGSVELVNTKIEHVLHALYNVGGFLSSYRTVAPRCAYGYAWIDGPTTWLLNDESSADSTVLPWRTGIELLGSGSVDIYRTNLIEYVNGIVARDGLVSTDIAHRILPGQNRIYALSNVLVTEGKGRIDFGDSLGEYGTNNCFTLQNPQTGFHCYAAGDTIESADSYWGVPTPTIFGNVNVSNPRFVCGVPFAGDQNREALSKAAAPPPSSSAARRALMRAFRDSNHVLLRGLVGSQLRAMRTGAPDRPLIQFLRFTVLRIQDLADLRDSLLIELLAHPSMDTKLDAADLLTDVRRFSDALEVLGAYSFDGSAALKKQYLKRRALFLPHAFRGGYSEGLQALDSLRIISNGDPSLEPLFRLYPLLYSGLHIDESSQGIPKQSATPGFWDRILPEGVEIESNYPNPFSDVTSFTFKLGEDKHVRLAIYDAMGREVAVITDADYQRGVHSTVLRSGDLPNGLYFYRLTTDEGAIQRKMLLMR